MSTPSPHEPAYADRVYRSPMAVVTGVLILAMIVWLCGDAVVRGVGGGRWIGLAAALCAVPLTVAFTIRPAVFANEDRMRVRNPFRIIELPWGIVDAVRAGYSAEVLADGAKYQLWSVPVSLRERKKANRSAGRREAPGGQGAGGRGAGGTGDKAPAPVARASADKAVEELTELAERGAGRPGAQGPVSVRWAWEIIVPAVLGAVALAVLLAAG
ncbi:PH domain-containing protein [Streptomyces polychromogenes]|uniref:PH domain-containing protein n=1 Tax=Streptomyces polychromogenes TaxID=67342 RepID=A0ABP3F8E8_9ACTN